MIAYLDFVTRISLDDKRRTFVAQGLTAGMRVLDVGCGTGDDVRSIAALVGDDGFVAGTDSSHAMIAAARARGVPKPAAFYTASAAQLPFEDASFDAARAERVLQHVADPSAALRELRRVVRPGGSLLLIDQDWDSLSVAGADRDVTRRILHAFADALANGTAGRDARARLRAAGFPTVEIAPMISTPSLPIAHELILRPAIDAALARNAVDPAAARDWLSALLRAEAQGGFYCAVVVVAALAR